MDSFSFYKSLYDRELSRRYDLDNSVNIPVTLLTALVTGNYFITKDSVLNLCLNNFYTWLILITYTLILISFYFLSKAYNNLLDGFDYQNLSYPSELRKFEKSFETDNECEEYNKSATQLSKVNFENKLIDQINLITDDNKKINDRRGEFLFKARIYIILSFFITSLQLVYITFN